MSLLERLNHAFSGGIMFVQPIAETCQAGVADAFEFMDKTTLSDIVNTRKLFTTRRDG